MDALLIDLRYAVRSLRRRPALSALAVLTLAIGVGVNTVVFSAVNGLLFHPFVFPGVDRLGWVMLSAPGNPDGELSWTEYNELRRSSRAFDAVAAAAPLTLAVDVDGHAEPIFASVVSTSFFNAIDARPEAGRTLQPADAAALEIPGVVSHRFWTSRQGGGSVAGRTLKIGARLVSVVGVMPDDFQAPTGLYAPDIWLPLERLDSLGAAKQYTSGDLRWLSVIARLAPGATDAQAQTDLATFSEGLRAGTESRSAEPAHKLSARFYPMRAGHPEVRGIAPYAWIVMAIVGVVLLLACFNVASLLLTRATERRREIGVRVALGADRARLVRGLLMEGLMLAAASGVAALILAGWSERLLSAFALPAPVPQRLHMQIDRRLVEFTAIVTLFAGILPALIPALQSTGRNIIASMRLDAGFGGGFNNRPSRIRNLLVGAQIAGSTLFLATALLCVRSFMRAAAVEPGFDVDRTVTATLDPAQFGYDVPRTQAALQAMLRRLNDSPAIAHVAAADRAPFSVGYPLRETVARPGQDCAASRCKPVLTYAITTAHFAALGIPLVGGHEMTDTELRSGTGVVVSEALAAQLWPNESAVGQTLSIGMPAHTVHVTGVAADVQAYRLSEAASPVLYRALVDADLTHGFTLIARASGDPRAAVSALRDVIRSVAPGVPATSLGPMRDRLALPLWPYRTGAGFFLICGALALILAAVGLFGVTYFTVRQRTREFGIRIAVGARPWDVVRQVLREALGVSVPAAIAGLAAALVAARLLSGMLFGLSPVDPVSFASAAVVQTCVTLAACAVPAHRATRVDPMIALRVD